MRPANIYCIYCYEINEDKTIFAHDRCINSSDYVIGRAHGLYEVGDWMFWAKKGKDNHTKGRNNQ